MGKVQIFKLIFLIVIVLLACTTFVCSFILKKYPNLDFKKKEVRVLLRIRVGCFLGMLVSLLIIILIT